MGIERRKTKNKEGCVKKKKKDNFHKEEQKNKFDT
jgi:hypothetical protein